MAASGSWRSTSSGGLDAQSPAWKLWEKAKELGVWNPAAVDLARDREDWQRLDEGERDVLLRLTSLFVGGEEAVTVHLLPLVQVIAAEGRLEEEMFLTAFLFEEAKHVDAFHRFLVEVAQERSDLSRYHSPSWRVIFHEELPRAMGRLRHDPSPLAQAEASATYNMIVEGVLAETGYHGYHATLGRNGILPGMQELVSLIKRDESRHIAYGVHLLSRLAAEGGGGGVGGDSAAPKRAAAGRHRGHRRAVCGLRHDALRPRSRGVHRLRPAPVRLPRQPHRARPR